ncbi:hypothetical protein V8G54_034137 [Vigna mungo]|uniref:Uncharacterized protein n=1 Tax=Vigna mungo TaxID=3915 RepID=A0AAQ3MP65_VIGMU
MGEVEQLWSISYWRRKMLHMKSEASVLHCWSCKESILIGFSVLISSFYLLSILVFEFLFNLPSGQYFCNWFGDSSESYFMLELNTNLLCLLFIHKNLFENLIEMVWLSLLDIDCGCFHLFT